MLDINEKIGGTEVIPGSHKLQEEQAKVYKNNDDWTVLNYNDPLQGKGKLVEAKAGDLILWDSRTVHGGFIGEGLKDEEADQHQGLSRLSFTVCMTQRNRATEKVL